MASNVFGVPITNDTLMGMPEYVGREITPIDRAHVALNMKNSGNKDVNARQYVENLKSQWGTGVSTLCLVYNATGDTARFVTSHDYYGRIGQAPYPARLANGQWGGFLHVKRTASATGSTAAVVYRSKNNVGDDCDWMFSWSNPWNRSRWDNMVYTEIRKAHHYADGKEWGRVSALLYNSGLQGTGEWNGCLSHVSTGSSTSPIFEAILTLKGA